MTNAMSFDPRCYDLAELFLSDEPPEINTEAARNQLAQHIQTAIEDEIAVIRDAHAEALAENSQFGAGA